MYQVIEYASTEEVEVLFVQSFNLYFPSFSLVDRMEVFIDEVSPLLNDLEAYFLYSNFIFSFSFICLFYC